MVIPKLTPSVLGSNWGGVSTKKCTSRQKGRHAFGLVITDGRRHDSSVFEELMEKGKRLGAVTPCLGPRRLTADGYYSNHRIRGWLPSEMMSALTRKVAREVQEESL